MKGVVKILVGLFVISLGIPVILFFAGFDNKDGGVVLANTQTEPVKVLESAATAPAMSDRDRDIIEKLAKKGISINTSLSDQEIAKKIKGEGILGVYSVSPYGSLKFLGVPANGNPLINDKHTHPWVYAAKKGKCWTIYPETRFFVYSQMQPPYGKRGWKLSWVDSGGKKYTKNYYIKIKKISDGVYQLLMPPETYGKLKRGEIGEIFFALKIPGGQLENDAFLFRFLKHTS